MKFFKWIGAAIVFLFAAFLATQSRTHKQRAEKLTEREIKELAKGKQANLTKAAKLGDSAKVSLTKSSDAKKASEAKVQQLEKSDATNLADRVRDFNKRL